jgi:murein DD-endopeptidase MepM/ murein hydrolase activator NlpD
MQLFLISATRKKILSITLGTVSLCVYLVLSLVCSLLVFYAGSQYSLDLTRDSIKEMYTQVAPVWNQELLIQQNTLSRVQDDALNNLDALATRLSKLQAHVMRLDALGSRLASMADINEIDFDIESIPGLGGPKPISDRSSMKVNDFLSALEELGVKIQDRSEKLAAMESMLIDRTLQDQTVPAGRPTTNGWISSLFGERADPITGKIEFHDGIDYAGKSGSPLLAVASGIITWSGVRYGYGNLIEINHGNGYHTRYAHNKENIVFVGQKVDKGQVIGLMGSTGRSTGTHVHFEVIHNGKAVNPQKYNSLN